MVKCRPTVFMAAVAGEIKWLQAYHLSNKGSNTTLGFRYTFLRFILLAFNFIRFSIDQNYFVFVKSRHPRWAMLPECFFATGSLLPLSSPFPSPPQFHQKSH